MNHSYEIDWVVGWALCERLRLLGVSKLIFALPNSLLKNSAT